MLITAGKGTPRRLPRPVAYSWTIGDYNKNTYGDARLEVSTYIGNRRLDPSADGEWCAHLQQDAPCFATNWFFVAPTIWWCFVLGYLVYFQQWEEAEIRELLTYALTCKPANGKEEFERFTRDPTRRNSYYYFRMMQRRRRMDALLSTKICRLPPTQQPALAPAPASYRIEPLLWQGSGW